MHKTHCFHDDWELWQETKTLQYKTIPVTKHILSNCLNCSDFLTRILLRPCKTSYSSYWTNSSWHVLPIDNAVTHCVSTECSWFPTQHFSIQSLVWLYRFNSKGSKNKQTNKKFHIKKFRLATGLSWTILSSLKSWY